MVCLGVLQLVEEGTAEGLRYNGKGKGERAMAAVDQLLA